jgi:shikimate kinase
MDSKNIFIVGAMGSGKSSIGRLLAKKMKREFVDTDHEIEKISNYDISTIFQKYGEEIFREKETEVLINLNGITNHIIATGGGIILKKININIMKEMGLIVFLDINLKAQYKRVKYRKHRPLLKNSNLEEKLKILKNERDTIYNNISNYIIDVSDKDKNTIVEEIENKLL